MRQIKWKKFLQELTEESEENDEEQVFKMPKQHMIRTLGIFPNDYNAWMAHCNFDINNMEILQLIRSIEGVEECSILSRYRFVVTIGEMFNSSKVKIDIQNKLNIKQDKFIVPLETHEAINDIFDNNKDKYTIIYIAPNNKIDFRSDDSLSNLVEIEELYNEAKSKIGGKIIKSWSDMSV